MGEFLLSYMPWQTVFIIFSISILFTLLLLPFMRVSVGETQQNINLNMRAMVGKAVADPSYLMIFLGFFSCGYQLGFLTAHFPAFVTEMCSPILTTSGIYDLGITSTSILGAISISLIGLANIAGTLGAGYLGKTYSKKYLLSSIYLGRTMICTVFILAPITPLSVVLFSVLMGSLWLATVPLTSGLIAQLYGLRYMGTLYGIVFFSHQLGGFTGIWLGGRLYDMYGNYTLVWWIGIAVGAFSALVHLPIKEQQKTWV
jgi:predicted MFS family arabinose efflux permease